MVASPAVLELSDSGTASMQLRPSLSAGPGFAHYAVKGNLKSKGGGKKEVKDVKQVKQLKEGQKVKEVQEVKEVKA
jgi:hypothetical protein